MARRKKIRIQLPTDDELADRWVHQHPDTVHGFGGFRRYGHGVPGVWSEISLTRVEAEVLKILEVAKTEGCRPTSSRLHSVIELCRIKTTISNERFDLNPNLFCFKNCTLDIITGETRPHRREDLITIAFPYDYDPKAEADSWLWALSRFPAKLQAFFQEYFAYCLTQETKLETLLWLDGPSGSGKSTIIAALQAMIGSKGVQLASRIWNDQSLLYLWLWARNVILSPELQLTSIPTNLDILNKIVSGETLLVEKKYEHPYEYVSHAKVVCASTFRPNIPPDNGLYRRVKVIKLPSLSESERDPNLKY